MTPLAPPLPISPPLQSRPPIWPTVIGVLSIVSGVNIIVHGSWQSDIMALQRLFDSSSGVMFSAPALCGIIFQRLLALACATLAIVGGSLMAKRKPIGRTLLLIYAIARLVHLVLQPLTQWLAFRAAYSYSGLGMQGLYSGVVSLLLHSPFPIVLMVWLFRKQVVQQTRAMRDPLQRAAMRPATGSAWPVVIGLLLLVTAATTVVSFGLYLIGMPLLMASLGRGSISDVFGASWGMLLFFAARSTIPPAIGIIGGLGLLGRRRWTGIVTPIWAGILVVATILGPVVMAISYGVPDEVRFLLPQMLGLIPSLVLPVFVLIWMFLPKIRAQMSAWPRRRGRPA